MINIYCKRCGKHIETLKENEPKIIKYYEVCSNCLFGKDMQQINRDAVNFRMKKIKEVRAKENPEFWELAIIKRWEEMFEE